MHFYIIKDDQANSNSPRKLGLEFVGELDEESFNNLQNKGIIDNRFDYYSDFRFGTILIEQIQQKIIQKQLQADSDVKKLTQLFDSAIKKQSGLIAYGD
jgi:hypothetical protein